LQEVILAKVKTPVDEKFEKQDFNLFEAITAIDKKDYGYYDRLTPEQTTKVCSVYDVTLDKCSERET
jgi:hypothetical protein